MLHIIELIVCSSSGRDKINLLTLYSNNVPYLNDNKVAPVSPCGGIRGSHTKCIRIQIQPPGLPGSFLHRLYLLRHTHMRLRATMPQKNEKICCNPGLEQRLVWRELRGNKKVCFSCRPSMYRLFGHPIVRNKP